MMRIKSTKEMQNDVGETIEATGNKHGGSGVAFLRYLTQIFH